MTYLIKKKSFNFDLFKCATKNKLKYYNKINNIAIILKYKIYDIFEMW